MMSVRATSSSMKCCGMRPAMGTPKKTGSEPTPRSNRRCDACRRRVAEAAVPDADPGLTSYADSRHVRAPSRLLLHHAHHLAHVLDRGGTGRGDGVADQRIELAVRQLCRQIRLQQLDLPALLVCKVLPAALLELRNGFLALLDHFLEDDEHLSVVERDPLIDFALLDRSLHQADGREAFLLGCPHGRLHVLRDALLERHEPRLSRCVGGEPTTSPGCCASGAA